MARTKNPRSPSISLDDAINKAIKVYEKERHHAAPSEVIAQDIGYKSANNGAALAVLASLRYYGLLVRPKEGHLAVAKDVETYMYAPSESIKNELLQKWIRTPPVFLEIIDKYDSNLPSDATLRFDLIGQGFSPQGAEALIPIFKRSADFVGLYDSTSARDLPSESTDDTPYSSAEDMEIYSSPSSMKGDPSYKSVAGSVLAESDADRIPVRLPGGRRAWLIIPSPFFEADKKRLQAHIDLLLVDEEIEE